MWSGCAIAGVAGGSPLATHDQDGRSVKDGRGARHGALLGSRAQHRPAGLLGRRERLGQAPAARGQGWAGGGGLHGVRSQAGRKDGGAVRSWSARAPWGLRAAQRRTHQPPTGLRAPLPLGMPLATSTPAPLTHPASYPYPHRGAHLQACTVIASSAPALALDTTGDGGALLRWHVSTPAAPRKKAERRAAPKFCCAER